MKQLVHFAWLLPRNACILILRVYRAVISPLYGDVCRYYPSCSAYALQAIQQHGVIRGIWLGSRRIARCHPWAEGGIDDVPDGSGRRYALTRFGFVFTPASHTPRDLSHRYSAQRELVQHQGKG